MVDAIDRRSVLKKSAVGATITTVPGFASAQSGIEKEDLSGIIYNSVTGEYLGDASAKLRTTPSGMHGKLNVEDQTLSIDAEHRQTRTQERGGRQYTNSNYAQRLPSQADRTRGLKITKSERNVTGIIGAHDPSTQDSVGLFLAPQGVLSREEIAGMVNKDGY